MSVTSLELTHTSSMLARRIAVALVNLHLAVGSLVPCITETLVLSDAVHALAVQTWVAGALVNVDLTVGTWTRHTQTTLDGQTRRRTEQTSYLRIRAYNCRHIQLRAHN